MTGKGPTPVSQNVVQRSRQRVANLVQQHPAAGWFRVLRNDSGAPTRVDIYDQIGGGGWFDDAGVTAVDFVAQLAAINGDLEVHINSPGGDVFDGLAIYNALAQRTGNVTTVIDGLAASAASFIAMAGKARIACPGSMMMIHDAAGMCMGNAADMRDLAGLLDKVSDNIASIYADHSGRPDGWRDAMQAETWYTADEAVAAGLVQKLAQRPEQSALAAAARFDLTAYVHPPRREAAGAQPDTGLAWLRGQAKARSAAAHAPFTGTHAHAHTTMGAQGSDETHEHEHTHDADAEHGHAHPANRAPAPVLGLESMPVLDKALPVHHTATVDEPWDGPAAVAAMPNDDTVLEYCHAWQSAEAAATPHEEGDDDADDKKANYKFPHHKTKGAPANINACSNGLARLEGSSIPDADKAGVRAHLQAHLDDARKGDDAKDSAETPGWLRNHAADATAPTWLTQTQPATPAWLNLAKEAHQ